MLKRIIFSVIVIFAIMETNAQQKIVSPEFPGGKKYLKEYLNNEINKIQYLDDLETQGVVTVLLEITPSGRVQDPMIGISLDPTLDSITLSIVTDMPKWIAGSIDGQKTKMKTSISIPFIPKKERESKERPLQISIMDIKEVEDGEEFSTEKPIQISIADVREIDDEEVYELSPLRIIEVDVEGEVEEEYGIDIAELNEHKVIVEESPDEKPFVMVEQMPSFEGGEAEMHKFIKDNLVYPTDASEAGIQGRVILRFVVQKDGSLSNIQIIRGIDPNCNREAIRVIKSMPKWKPGKQNGREVPVYYTLPFVFRLD